jgi:uncharacterized glyoxalase superfamily protein PhnB
VHRRRADGRLVPRARLARSSVERARAIYAALREVDGAELLEEPADSRHGFGGFSFRDPEGNIWDVA